MLSPVRLPYVCRVLSVEIFGNISTAFGTFKFCRKFQPAE